MTPIAAIALGKRSEARDSHDRHACSEGSSVLQRIETHRGLANLTTNNREAIDSAFLRRLNFIVEFPFPGADLCERLWRQAVPAKTPTKDLEQAPVGCEIGKIAFRETKRSAQMASVRRRARTLRADTIERLQPLYADVDIADVRIRTRCRLPSNRFQASGSISAMTFGNAIYWRDELDGGNPRDLVPLVHELVHVEQVKRHGGKTPFAVASGTDDVEGGGRHPSFIDEPSRYHPNPLEADAYSFAARFRDSEDRVLPDSLPAPTGTT